MMPETETSQKSCPNCGQPLEFDPAAGSLRCGACGSSAETAAGTENAEIHEKEYLETLAALEADGDAESAEELPVECANCGAAFLLPGNVAAGRCPYCKSPIAAGREQRRRLIRPESLLPFRLTAEQAGECFRNWLRGRWFLPGRVVREARAEPPEGVFLPFWTYDSDTVTDYAGQRGEYYYVTVTEQVTVNGKSETRTRQERRIRWYPACGAVRNRFDDLLVPGGSSLPEKLVRELEPWDLDSLVACHPDLIRGFREECYRVGLADGFRRAREMMEPRITASIENDIGGDEQRILTSRTSHSNIRFKHLLLPAWVSSFRFGSKQYIFTVNARTGEVQGERPWSAWKILFAALLAAGALAVLTAWLLRQ